MLSGVRFLPSDSRASAQTAVSFFSPCKSVLSVSSVVRFGFFVACGQPVCAQPLFLISLVAVAKNELNPSPTRPGVAFHPASPHTPLDRKAHDLPGPAHCSSFVCRSEERRVGKECRS